MSELPILLQPEERVLSTLNADGSRRWLRPRPSPGAFLARRRITAYALMVVFFLLPHLHLHGKPLVLLDLPRRQFTLFGTTFLSSETLLVMLLSLAIAFTIFFVTAVFGRVWCGWACPQTVYMEFLFRPIEYWIEGGAHGTAQLDLKKGLSWRRALKWVVFAGLALFLAHTFLAYFVPVGELAQWMRRSPVEHPISFFIAIGTTALIFFDYAYFREQTCLVACPYGRLQSVLLDKRSLIVGYDVKRGEPRMKGLKTRPPTAGDCIDCGLCVLTCPTGIDIRQGLQMECIHCTQCADACDLVMAKIGKPPGLIRYGSREGFERTASRRLRPRVVVYPLAALIAFGLLVWQIGARQGTEVALLRASGVPFTLEPGGSVMNQVRVRVTNRTRDARSYVLALEPHEGNTLLAPTTSFVVAPGESQSAIAVVLSSREGFVAGTRAVTFRVRDDRGAEQTLPWRLMGPEPAAAARESS